MSLPCIVQVLCATWYVQVNLIRIFVTFVHRIKQKEYRLTLAWILISRYQSRVNDRMKIERTSNMVNMLEEFARHPNIVLQWRINKIASRMSLKRKETIVPESSVQHWNILFSPPPAAKHAFHRSSDQCKDWEWILKIFLYSPETKRSIFFSMYLLRMTKKMNYFLQYLVLGERENVSLVQYRSNSFFPWERLLVKPAGSLLCRFVFAFNRLGQSFASNCNAYSSS